MRVKVCGMRESQNIKDLVALKPDFMGFIFYEKSPRFVGNDLDKELLLSFPKYIKKVGVFVNANIDFVITQIKKYKLDFVQLSGDEKPEYCKTLSKNGVGIIKAFKLNADFAMSQLYPYKPIVDHFLFDTPSLNHGGTGNKFDWSLLHNLPDSTSYFLAGGIGSDDVSSIFELSQRPYSVDVNSKFEISPAFKNIEMLKQFIMNLKQPILA